MEALITQTTAIQTETIYASKAAVVNSAGRLLLLWRKYDDAIRPGGIDFPGGQQEAGETPVQALEREFLEEIGQTTVGLDTYWSRTMAPRYEDRPIGRKEIITSVHVLFAEDWSEDSPQITLTRAHEHARAEWWDPAAVKRHGLLARSASKSACLDVILDLQSRQQLPRQG